MISDGGLKFLTGMKQLENLSLKDCGAVSNATLQRIKSLKNLAALNLEGTACNMDGIQALKKLLPDCQITIGGTTY